MAESGLNPQQIQYMVAAMQNPQAAMQIQQQQALAQQMMTQGAEQPNPNETINEGIGGAHTVPFNKWGGLARAGEQMTGAYLQNQNNQKLGAMLQQANGQQGGNQQPQDGAPQGQGGVMSDAAPLTGNVMKDYAFSQLNPEGYKQALQLKQAAVMKAAEQSQTPVIMNGHTTFITPPAMQQRQQAPQMPPQQPPVQSSPPPQGNPAITPQSPSGQAALGSMYGTQPQGTAAPVNLTTNGQQNVDWNNPVEVKRAEAQATKEGENTADAAKTVAAINSSIDSQIKNLTTLKTLSGDMPFGSAADKELWLSRNVGARMDGGDYDKNWQDFNTLNKQMFVNGLMGSIPPGSRLDIPIVKSLQEAKQVDPYASPPARNAVIDRHIETLLQAKQNAAQNYGLLNGTQQSSQGSPQQGAPPAVPPSQSKIIQYNAQGQRVQ